MNRTLLATLLLLASIADARADPASPQLTTTTASGFEYGLNSLLQYDLARSSGDVPGDGGGNEDWRRTGIAIHVRREGMFEVLADYDVKAKAWMDVYARMSTRAGKFRVGQFKTPVGMDDGATSSAATTFLERALPEVAIHQGRRQGVDWSYAKSTTWLLIAGVFAGDTSDKSGGRTIAGRAVYTPVNDSRALQHLGVSASREWRDDETARFSAYPEVAITSIRPLGSGDLTHANAIDRYGLELAWRDGAWSAQGEWLEATVHRNSVPGDFHASGGYMQASWLATGETKTYRNGGFGNPRPLRSGGALEFALRYSMLDLDNGSIDGGRQYDWTVGTNWYVDGALKLQLNYVRVRREREATTSDSDIVAARMQYSF